VARFIGYEPCPACRKRGSDRAGDNLGMYSDGSGHCFSCGYHLHPKFSLKLFNKEPEDDKEKAVLPSDFTREVPADGWKWLLQYGLSYTYWKPFTGYSPKENRLVITVGTPVRFSQGRALTVGDRKWRNWGNGHSFVETLREEVPGPVILVEDIISAHKVSQHAPTIPLFGTSINDLVVKELQRLDRPVKLWLDDDQYQLLPKKINRLQTFLDHPVTYIHTDRDPKAHSLEQIKEILNV
jgi:hypothetical protein